MDKSTNVSNIYVAPGYSKLKIYCQKSELGLDTDSDHLITEQAASEVSDDEIEVDGQAKNEGAFKKSGSPNQFRLNGVKEKTPSSKSRIVADEEYRGEPNLPAELLKLHRIFGHCSFLKLQIMVEIGILHMRLAKCVIPV